MLKQRLLTILILVPLLVWAIYSASAFYFAVATMLVCTWIAWEWAYVCKLGSLPLRAFYTLICLAGCILNWIYGAIAWYFLLSALVLWVLALYLVIDFARGSTSAMQKNNLIPPLLGLFFIPALWLCLTILRSLYISPALVMYALLIVWLSDSAAYVTGRLWGKHKLAPRVSPKKTWAGVYGAVFACFILSFIGHYWFVLPWGHTGLLLFATLVSGLWSVVGDLFESVLKRKSGIKDSGTLLPGHGGILDRTDALLAGVPWFTLCVLLLHI